MSQKKKVACPLCSHLFATLSNHLRFIHGIRNLQERSILLKLAGGRVSVGKEPCPIDACTLKVARLGQHLKTGHHELPYLARLEILSNIKRRVALSQLRSLRQSKPHPPMNSTLDQDEDLSEDPSSVIHDATAAPPEVRPNCSSCEQLAHGNRAVTLELSLLRVKYWKMARLHKRLRSRVARLSQRTGNNGEEENKREERQQQSRSTSPALSPSTQSTSRRSQQEGAVQVESSLTPTSSHAGTPSTSFHNTGHPVVRVCSQSVKAQRGKRPLAVTHQVTPKRPRKNVSCQKASAGDVSWRSSSVHVDDDAGADETTSTPKPQQPAPGVTRIKNEEEAASELVECTDDAAGPSTRMVNSTTQTAALEVKLEPESQSKPGGREKGCGNNGAELDNDTDTTVLQQTFKQENGESSQSGNQGEQALTNGVTHMESYEIAEPSYLHLFPDLSEVQKQQDQLLELMQDTAQERDILKEEVQRLNAQLREGIGVKREFSHQTCQTEAQKDYKSLFEKAKKKVHDLVKDKEFLSNAADISTGANAAPDEEPDVQEISLQVGGLVHELDQRQKKMDELRSKLVSLEEEKSALAAQCEELRLSLQQERETAQSRTMNVSSQSEAGGSAGSGSNSEDHESLIKLRKKIGLRLISYIPDLDLEQVNYDCTVIDELLEQYVNRSWDSDAAFPPFSLC